jgi:hypothetical protein
MTIDQTTFAVRAVPYDHPAAEALRQPDAVRLYEREGYTRIEIFPPYTSMTYSTCLEKPVVR